MRHLPRSARGFVLFALAVTTLLGCGAPPPQPQVPTFDATAEVSEQRFLEEVDRTRGFRDCFSVLRDPVFVAADGDHRLTSTEQVIGLDLGDVQFAYPARYLNHHEIVEHTAAGLDLLVCW